MAPSPSPKVNLVYFWLGRHGPDKSLSRTGARVRGWWPNEIHRSESPEPIPATDRVQVVVGTESVETPAAQELRPPDSKPWRSGSVFSPFQFFQHGRERYFHLRKADVGRGRGTSWSTLSSSEAPHIKPSPAGACERYTYREMRARCPASILHGRSARVASPPKFPIPLSRITIQVSRFRFCLLLLPDYRSLITAPTFSFQLSPNPAHPPANAGKRPRLRPHPLCVRRGRRPTPPATRNTPSTWAPSEAPA
jgi:hypothetical protein